jgi:hypothetical protein
MLTRGPTRAECERKFAESYPIGLGRPRPTAAEVETARVKERERRRKATALKRKLDKLLVAAESAIVVGHDHLAWFDRYIGTDSAIGRALWPEDGSAMRLLGACQGDDGDLYKRKVDLVTAKSFAAACHEDSERSAEVVRRARSVESWGRYLPGSGEPELR